MACSALFVSILVVGATGAPASSLRGSGRAAQGKCCFNGCDDDNSCVTGYCASQELCLRPQPDGGCDSSPPYGRGAKPSWCPAAAPNQVASIGPSSSEQASAAPIALNATEGKCCFNGCDDETSCVTGYCASQELCLKPQPDGGCDSSPPYGHGAKPSWCPATAPNQLASIGPSSGQASAALFALNATEGKCCFNGCDDENSCVTGACASQEMCLKPQLDGGCNSSPPYGHGAKPSWCPAAAPNQVASIGPSSGEQAWAGPIALNATEGKCCFNGCDDENSCVTGYCASKELCLRPQPDGGCDSSPPYGDGAKPSWCPATAPNQLASIGPSSSEQAWAGPVALNATEGKCCFNGCDDETSCVTGYCASQEMCLKPQLDFGCNSSPPYGHGARPSWCPAADPN